MLDILKDKKGVFFDLGWTLDTPASGDWMLTKKFYEFASGKLLSSIPADTLDNAVIEGFRYLETRHLLTTCEEEAEQFTVFYGIINDRCGLGLSPEAVRVIALDRTYNMKNYVFYPDARKVLAQLSKTHRLGVISDTWPSATYQLKAGHVGGYFSAVTFSSDIGVFKPNPEIFRRAIAALGLPPEETAFIDDSVRNLEAAAKLGITPILAAMNPASDVDTEYAKIHSLSELIA